MIYDFEYGKQNGEARHTERETERERGREREGPTCIDGIEGRIKKR